MKAIVVLTTTPDIEEAESLARGIVEEKLAACVQVLPQIRSFYYWEGAVQDEPEHLLLIKTVQERYDELEAFIREKHGYDVPEVIALNADNVSKSYLGWVKDYIGSKY